MVLAFTRQCRLLMIVFCFCCVGDGFCPEGQGGKHHRGGHGHHHEGHGGKHHRGGHGHHHFKNFTEEQKKYWQSLTPEEQKKEFWSKKMGMYHGKNAPQVKAKIEGREKFKQEIDKLIQNIKKIKQGEKAKRKELQGFLKEIEKMESEHVELLKPVHEGQRGIKFSNEFKNATETSMKTIALFKKDIKKELEDPLEQALLLLKAKLLTLAKSLHKK